MKSFLFKKQNRLIEPVIDPELQLEAKKKLEQILGDSSIYLPSKYREPGAVVALYSPSGKLERANALILEGDEGAYSLANKLNDLDGKTWTKFTCSWFIFNALNSDLKEEKTLFPDSEDHPATFSPTMVEGFIRFFTREGMNVLDPFVGIGSTLIAASRSKRNGFGVELNPNYFKIAQHRVPAFKNQVFNMSCENIDTLQLPPIDFCISSPPYWNVLNRSTKDFEQSRSSRGWSSTYSTMSEDLGNVNNYEEFLDRLSNVYRKIYPKMRNHAYVVVILKNVKSNGVFYPLAWDFARKMSDLYILKDEKIWIQDKIALAPYGYPYSWVSNILHHYCLIFQKVENE